MTLGFFCSWFLHVLFQDVRLPHGLRGIPFVLYMRGNTICWPRYKIPVCFPVFFPFSKVSLHFPGFSLLVFKTWFCLLFKYHSRLLTVRRYAGLWKCPPPRFNLCFFDLASSVCPFPRRFVGPLLRPSIQHCRYQ